MPGTITSVVCNHMRILIDVRGLLSPQPSGVGHYGHSLLQAFAASNRPHEYLLFSSGPQKIDLRATLNLPADRFTLWHYPKPNKILNFLWSQKSARLEKTIPLPFDAAFFPNLNFIPPSRVPQILTVHDLSFVLFPEFFSWSMRLWHRALRPAALFRQAEKIIVPSASTAHDLQTFFSVPDEKISVIPLAAAPLASTAENFQLPARFALFIGTHEPRKNLPTIVLGLERYRRQSGDNLSLIICGNHGWKNSNWKKICSSGQRSTWIHDLDYVSPALQATLLAKAAVLLWPSLYEGFGLPVLEAMQASLPVITSQISSLPELTKNQALLVNPYDENQIASSLQILFSSPALAQNLSTMGKIQAAKFAWSETAAATLKVIESTQG